MNDTKTWMTMLCAVGALSGCGVQSVVTDGTYQSGATGQLPNATLVVDLAAKTASVTLSGTTTAVVLQMTALPVAQWEKGCPGNYGSVAVETWTLSPDPAVLGAYSLTGPRLVAGCSATDKADPDEVVLKGTSEPNQTQYNFAFQRLTR